MKTLEMSAPADVVRDWQLDQARRGRRRGWRVLATVLTLAVCATLAVVAVARARELSNRKACAKRANQLATCQNAYATDQNKRGQPESFFRGTEWIISQTEPSTRDGDASRALLYFVRRNSLDSFAALACPSDPFVAVLDGSAAALETGDIDLHGGRTLNEGLPAGAPWVTPTNPASTQAGFTYFSYSMQSVTTDKWTSVHPMMSARVPLFGDRNPGCRSFTDANPGLDTRDLRNSWNHNGEGVNLAYADGHSEFVTDADRIEVRTTPGEAATGFDQLYSDTKVGAAPVRPDCLAPGKAGSARNSNIWLTD